MVKHPAVGKGYRIIWLALVIVGALFVSTVFSNAAAQNARRKATCEASEQIYDSQFVMVHYLAGQLEASKVQEAAAIRALAHALGPRPVC